MQLVIQDEHGQALSSHSNYSLDLQYGDDKCDFVLYVPGVVLEARQRILVDGTPFGGIIDKKCPSKTIDNGESIFFKGRTVQGVLGSRIIEPPSGKTHLAFGGDANRVIESVIEYLDLDDYFEVPEYSSGINIPTYKFYRWVDGWKGLRMAMATGGARLSFTCHDGKHKIEAVNRTSYGTIASEQTYFELEMDCLPVNHVIGLGKGQGLGREVCHWYANAFGELSQTQSLFGIYENCCTYNLNSEEGSELSSKTKAKLIDYQQSSEAKLTLPPGVQLDVGDVVPLSISKYNIEAMAEVIEVVLKATPGVAEVNYRFGTPDFPKDEE